MDAVIGLLISQVVPRPAICATVHMISLYVPFFFFQAEDGIRDLTVTGVQTCALPISASFSHSPSSPQTQQAVMFTGSASGGTAPYSFSWTFGDRGAGTGSSVSHSYQSTDRKSVV